MSSGNEYAEVIPLTDHLLDTLPAGKLDSISFVRTLYQLPLPEQEFYVGNREFDPKEVGYLNRPGSTNFKLDATKPYNSNKGHNFGKEMTD